MKPFRHVQAVCRELEKENLPGYSLRIMTGEETALEIYQGVHDIETGTPLNETHLFRQASLSKIPLYTTMMILWEQGAFDLQDPISRFFPEWKESNVLDNTAGKPVLRPAKREIRVEDILTMRCGLPYCNMPDPESKDPIYRGMSVCLKPLFDRGHFTLREQIAAVSEAPLAADPGERWIYGFSSELAAGVVEAVTGMEVTDAMKKLLFAPLGITDIDSVYHGDAQQRMVGLYSWDSEGKLIPTFFPMDDKFLPGEEHDAGWRRLYGNVRDYSKISQMLALDGQLGGVRILKENTVKEMRKNRLTPSQMGDFEDPLQMGYGYGYGVRTFQSREKAGFPGGKEAFGWTGAFGTFCESDPQHRASIVFMHNTIPNKEAQTHLRIKQAFYEDLSEQEE